MSTISRHLEIETLEPTENDIYQQYVKVRGHKDLLKNIEEKFRAAGSFCDISRNEKGNHAMELTIKPWLVNPKEVNYAEIGGVHLLKMQIIFILEGEGFKVNGMVFNQWNKTEKLMMYKEERVPAQLSGTVKEGYVFAVDRHI